MQILNTSGVRGAVDAEFTPHFCLELGQAIGTLLPLGSGAGLRASGTEPAIRVLAESTSEERMAELLDRGARLVQEAISAAR